MVVIVGAVMVAVGITIGWVYQDQRTRRGAGQKVPRLYETPGPRA
jgi:hypothetical protein